MKFLSVIIAWITALGAAHAALPQWSDEELRELDNGNLIIGQALLTRDGVEAAPATIEVKPVPARPELHPLPPVLDDRKALSAGILSRYFGKAHTEGLLDPQSLLSSQETIDIQYALELLAEESPVPIRLFLFDTNQKVPLKYGVKKVFQDNYSDSPSGLLVYYFIGQPERCKIHFGGTDAPLVPLSKVRELISGVRLGAKRRSDPMSQFDEFLRQLSLHLFWIEKSLEEKLQESIAPAATKTQKKKAASNKSSLLDKISHYSQYWWMIASGSAGFAIILLLGVYYVKRRRFQFPHIETSPRLNLPHGGGMGGTLSYKNGNLPPSAQRDQFNDVI